MRRTLLATPTVTVQLAFFAPGEHQPRHRDWQSRITLAVGGSFGEDSDVGSARIGACDLLFKSRLAAHEDRFGEAGARLVSFVFEDDTFEVADVTPWRVCRSLSSLRHAWAALEAAIAGDAAAVAGAASDLFTSDAHRVSGRTAPPWLKRLKDAIEADSLATVNVAKTARSAGVHPVHASRLFRSCFGASITEHAQAHSVRRALRALADAHTPLSQVAVVAGFCDQSHMTRVFRRVTGRTPGAHRALMGVAFG